MSGFGFSIGDFAAVGQIAYRIRQQFRKAGPEFEGISQDLKILTSAYDNAKADIPASRLTGTQQTELKGITQLCEVVLTELDEYLTTNASVGRTGGSFRPAKIRKVLAWDSGVIAEFRARINLNRAIFGDFLDRVIHNAIFKLQSDLDDLRQKSQTKRHGEHRQEVIDWLSDLEPHLQHNALRQQLDADLCGWFLETDDFKTWCSGSSRNLFLIGPPGVGKTMLAVVIVEHLHKSIASKVSGLAYFYCRQDRFKSLNSQELLLCLLSQMIRQCPEVPSGVQTAFNLHRNTLFKPSVTEVDDLFGYTVIHFRRLYIVIDALDELQQSSLHGSGRDLWRDLMSLQARHGVNLLFTSRFQPQTQGFMPPLPNSSCLELVFDDIEIRRYLTSRLEGFPRFVRSNKALQGEIESTILHKARGIILIARSCLESLVAKPSANLIRQTLQDLRDRDDSYDFIYVQATERMKSRGKDSWDLAQKAISCLAKAAATMTASALSAALAIQGPQAQFDIDSLVSIDDVLLACAGMLVVDDEYHISFFHETARKHFTHSVRSWISDHDLDIDITLRCMNCLMMEPPARAKASSSNNDEASGFDCFMDFFYYAAQNWAFHVARALLHPSQKDRILKLVDAFFRMNDRLFAYLSYLHSLDESIGDPAQFQPIHLAAKYGLTSVLQKYDLSPRILARTSHGTTPLHLAVEHGHVGTIRLLLSRGAPVNTPDNYLQTPITIANRLWVGRKDMWDVLNSHPETQSSGYYVHTSADYLPRSACKQASRSRRTFTSLANSAMNSESLIARQIGWSAQGAFRDKERFPWTSDVLSLIDQVDDLRLPQVRLALERHINIDRRDENGETALMCIARKTNFGDSAVEITKLLLELGADPDQRSHAGRSALSYAASNAMSLGVVNKLIDRGASVESRDDQGRSILSYAVSNIHISYAMISKLIGAGASVSSKDVKGRTAVHFAASEGSVNSLQLLVEYGADLDVFDDEHRSPLLYCTQNASHGPWNLRFLADAGVNVVSRDSEGAGIISYLALASATWPNVERDLAVLRGAGAEIDVANNRGRTPLSLAAAHGSLSCVAWLISEGVEIDRKDESSRTPLSWAAGQDNVESVISLLDAGADIQARDVLGCSALAHASTAGSCGAIAYLVGIGADKDMCTNRGRTALSLAAEGGSYEACELLLYAGADLSLEDDDGMTAVSYARQKDYADIVMLLEGLDASLLQDSARFTMRNE